MPRGALNISQKPEPLLGGVTGLEEAGDPADKFQRGVIGGVEFLKSVPGAIVDIAKSGATFPGDVFTGAASPEDPSRMMDLLGIMGGPGILAAKPGAAGMLGGKLAPKTRKPQNQINITSISDDLERWGSSAVSINSNTKGIRSGTHVGINPIDPRKTKGPVKAEIEFEVQGMDPTTGKGLGLTEHTGFTSPTGGRTFKIREGAKLATKVGQEILQKVFQDVDALIKKVQPGSITFVAARPELRKSYQRAVRKIAKKHNGKVKDFSGPDAEFFENSFEITFPNPKQYQSVRIE